jgi:hypothetical protein
MGAHDKVNGDPSPSGRGQAPTARNSRAFERAGAEAPGKHYYSPEARLPGPKNNLFTHTTIGIFHGISAIKWRKIRAIYLNNVAQMARS